MPRSRSQSVLGLAAALLGSTLAGAAPAAPPTPPRPHYRIEARLDAEAATLTGRVEIDWPNPSPTRAQSELVLRLYPNAFRGPDAPFLQAIGEESPELLRKLLEDERTGGLELLALRLDGGPDLAPSLDARTTVMRVPLPAPLAPGASVRLVAEFRVDVPKVVFRFGRAQDLFVFTQWYPQVAGYRCCGADEGFVAPEHHPHTEFFAGFADYEVALELPAAFVLGSTGVADADPEPVGDGRVRHRLRAERVHDFAWAADPDFVEERMRTRGGVEIRALCHLNEVASIDRFLVPAARAIERFGDWFGAYPYPQLTLVAGHPLHFAMEYPMLVTLPAWMLKLPRGVRMAELVTIHEVGHQWWYGLSANDETSEAWLDEGVNSFWTSKLTEELYGPDDVIEWLGLRSRSIEVARAGYAAAASVSPPATPGRDFLDREAYVVGSYHAPQLVFETLARRGGLDTLRNAFLRFMKQVRYGHPTEADLIAVFEREVGRESVSFLRTWLHQAGRTDPAVHSVVDVPLDPLADPESEDGARRQLVRVVQRGSIPAPVMVRVHFANGKSVDRAWSGEGWTALRFEKDVRIERVEVDPERTLALDANPTNNVWRRESSELARAQARTWTALATLLLSGAGP
jgi:hypothetical protein